MFVQYCFHVIASRALCPAACPARKWYDQNLAVPVKEEFPALTIQYCHIGPWELPTLSPAGTPSLSLSTWTNDLWLCPSGERDTPNPRLWRYPLLQRKENYWKCQGKVLYNNRNFCIIFIDNSNKIFLAHAYCKS